MFIVGEAYTREDIHYEVGGEIQSYLPTVDGHTKFRGQYIKLFEKSS